MSAIKDIIIEEHKHYRMNTGNDPEFLIICRCLYSSLSIELSETTKEKMLTCFNGMGIIEVDHKNDSDHIILFGH